MNNKKITINIQEYTSIDELEPILQSLFKHAFKARENAYAPYSVFKVGCAIELENGEMITGNNQENASFPVGICAERVAISYVHAKYPAQKIRRIAIVAGKDMNNDVPVAPCGLCRQSLLEYEHQQKSKIEIYFMGTKGKVIHFPSAIDLLPFAFTHF